MPHRFVVLSIPSAKTKIFGSVLLVVHWDGKPDGVIAQINALGCGLTLGI